MKIMSLKEVHPDDQEFVIKKLLRVTSWEEHSYFEEFADKEYEDSHCFYVVDDNDKVIAYMTIYEFNAYVQLDNIYVMSDCRGQGLATKMLKYMAKKFCKKTGKDIVLQVNTTNTPALICYLKFGFSIVGMWNGFYEYWGKKRNKDALLMRYKYVEKED